MNPIRLVWLTSALWMLVACGGGGSPGGVDGGAAGRDGGAIATDGGATSGAGVNPTDPSARPIRVYVAGESIERRNRWVEPPFAVGGALNERGGGALRNDEEEYGWAVPFADRLALRARDVRVVFVGTDTWLDGDDTPYDGTYPSTTPGATSAVSGTSIQDWLDRRRAELEQKTHCYDVAFASRGGNDFGNDNDADYKAWLQALIRLLAAGSSCRTDPLVYVTAHMPDDGRDPSEPTGDDTLMRLQVQRFVNRTQAAVTDLLSSAPTLRVRFVDLYTPFTVNRRTTAFPAEVWSTAGVPDYIKITRTGDRMHPRRLSSIYVGELAADALDLTELRTLSR